mmetsp:Transcript_571/g.378  ORF Transcript_571/g.378 Transcript_571/m.378 type:complete len:285 (+) Transcript_571:929-1783(+)
MNLKAFFLNRFKEVNPLALSFGVSVICHLFLFVSIIFIPNSLSNSKQRIHDDVINVNLVSMSAVFSNHRTKLIQPQPKVKVKTKEKTRVKSKKKAQLVSRDMRFVSSGEKKKSEKKNTSKQAIKISIEKLKKKDEKAKSEKIAEAVNQVKKKLDKAKPEKSLMPTSAIDMRQGLTFPSVDKSGEEIDELVRVYQAEIKYQIQRNWAFSKHLVGDGSYLETVLIIKIMSDGEVKDVVFEKRSGNDYLDGSALRAVMKSNPLPPLPEAFSVPYYKVGLTFNLSGPI